MLMMLMMLMVRRRRKRMYHGVMRTKVLSCLFAFPIPSYHLLFPPTHLLFSPAHFANLKSCVTVPNCAFAFLGIGDRFFHKMGNMTPSVAIWCLLPLVFFCLFDGQLLAAPIAQMILGQQETPPRCPVVTWCCSSPDSL